MAAKIDIENGYVETAPRDKFNRQPRFICAHAASAGLMRVRLCTTDETQMNSFKLNNCSEISSRSMGTLPLIRS